MISMVYEIINQNTTRQTLRIQSSRSFGPRHQIPEEDFREWHYDAMKTIFAEVCRDFEAELVEVDGESDHVHLPITYPPKVSVARLVNSLKGVSSRLLRKDYRDLRRYYWKNALWSPSYFASSCGGVPLDIMKHYIEHQTTPGSCMHTPCALYHRPEGRCFTELF
jgi:putative transposase